MSSLPAVLAYWNERTRMLSSLSYSSVESVGSLNFGDWLFAQTYDLGLYVPKVIHNPNI